MPPSASRLQALDAPLLLVDVGCRWGFAENLTRWGDQVLLVGFDPDVEECERLRALYTSRSVTIVPLALAGCGGERTLYVTRDPACSSLLEPDPYLTRTYPALRCAERLRTVQVPTITLDAWVREWGSPPIDFIKLDTQGTELEILRAGTGALASVRGLECEIGFQPIYRGAAVFSEVDAFLREQGFVLWKLTNLVHYSRQGTGAPALAADSVFYDDAQRVSHATFGGQLYWANARYVRAEVLRPASSSARQRARDEALFHLLEMPDVLMQGVHA